MLESNHLTGLWTGLLNWAAGLNCSRDLISSYHMTSILSNVLNYKLHFIIPLQASECTKCTMHKPMEGCVPWVHGVHTVSSQHPLAFTHMFSQSVSITCFALLLSQSVTVGYTFAYLLSVSVSYFTYCIVDSCSSPSVSYYTFFALVVRRTVLPHEARLSHIKQACLASWDY